jgi:hypothetical protein
MKSYEESLDKKKPTPYIVFLMNATGSMRGCFPSVKKCISEFVDALGNSDGYGDVLIEEWRVRVLAYRNRLTDASNWFIDNPFTGDIAEVKSQLAAIEAKGDGDEPESLLDAMYALTQWSAAEKGAIASPTGWRHIHDAARVVVIFTDAGCHPTFKTAAGSDGSVEDLIMACQTSRLSVLLHAPERPVYVDLAAMNRLCWEPMGSLTENPVQALNDYTRNTDFLLKEVLGEIMTARAIARDIL